MRVLLFQSGQKQLRAHQGSMGVLPICTRNSARFSVTLLPLSHSPLIAPPWRINVPWAVPEQITQTSSNVSHPAPVEGSQPQRHFVYLFVFFPTSGKLVVGKIHLSINNFLVPPLDALTRSFLKPGDNQSNERNTSGHGNRKVQGNNYEGRDIQGTKCESGDLGQPAIDGISK